MSDPSEPLLPVDLVLPSRMKLWIVLGVAVAVIAGGAAFFGSRAGNPGPAESASSDPHEPTPRTSTTEAPRRTPEDTAAGSAEERQAGELYAAAASFEWAEPAECEKRMQRWREVVTKYPTTSWARKADERYRAATTSLQALLDREFENARREAWALAAAGHYSDAVEGLQSYRAAQSRELLKRRAEVEISAVENASRLAYNETATRAREKVSKGDYAGAVAQFEEASRSALPDVAARCKTALAQLHTSTAARDQFEQSRSREDVRKAFREVTAPRVLSLVRARKYDAALKELSTAAAAPGNAGIRDEIGAERASIADASSFWDAFLKSLRGRAGQDAALLLTDGRRITGRISSVKDDRVVIETPDAPAEAMLDKLHADLLVGWTIGKSLPAEDGVTYVKAALFFFCEGRDDLARLYLATARELNGPAAGAEKIFREGYLRSAAAVK